MRAYARLIFVLASTAVLFAALYLGAEANWSRLAKPRVSLFGDLASSPLYRGLVKDLDSRLTSIAGRRIWEVSLEDLMETIEKDRRVASAQIRRRWPNQIDVQVQPREPQAILWTENGPVLIAADASLMEKAPIQDLPDVPILRGHSFKHDEALRMEALELIQSLPEVGVWSRQSIAELRFSSADGFELALGRGDVLIRMGRSPFHAKVERVQRVLNYLDGRQLDGRVIDARFTKKVVVRLRNAP